MIEFVTVTSQGQISIPAPIRKKFNIQAGDKLSVELEQSRLVIKPTKDVATHHYGLLHDSARSNQGKSIEEILVLEDKAIEELVLKRYIKHQK